MKWRRIKQQLKSLEEKQHKVKVLLIQMQIEV